MNILIFAEDYLPNIGGIAAHVHNLARALIARGCGVRVMTTRRPVSWRNVTVWRSRRVTRDEVPVLEIPVMYGRRYRVALAQQRYRFAPAARRELHAMKADIFHWHNIYFDPEVARGVRGRAGLVFTNHSSQFLQQLDEKAKRDELLSMFSFAHRLIAPSAELLERSIEVGYPRERGNYIPNGVDTTRFRSDKEARWRARRELGLADDVVGVLCARRVVPKCGVIYFAEALARLKTKKKIVALFAGLGEGALTWRDEVYEAEVRKALEKALPTVEARGLGQIANDRMPEIYNASDVAVLPSLLEATSISGLEAMASGLPLIGTTVGGIPDLIEDGKTGILVAPRNPDAIAAAIDALAESETRRREFGANARQRAIERFSWSSIAEQTVAVYERAREDFLSAR